MEYFKPKIIHALASALGMVIKIDERTRQGSMCHYVRVLIDIDMIKVARIMSYLNPKGRLYLHLSNTNNYLRCVVIGALLDMRLTTVARLKVVF